MKKENTELPSLKTMAERMVWARNRTGISQKGLGKLVGTDQSQIQKIEDGRTQNPKNLREIAEILGVTPAWLQYGDMTLESITWDEIVLIKKLRSLTPEKRELVKSMIAQFIEA